MVTRRPSKKRAPGRSKSGPRATAARIQKHVDKTGPVVVAEFGVCWRWTGALDPDGYGQVSVAGKTKQAHFASWEAVNGPVPEGHELDHLCRVRCCVNPDHLEAVTHSENVRRAVAAQKVEKRGGAGTVDNVEDRLCRVLKVNREEYPDFRLDDFRPALEGMLRKFG